MKNKHFSIVVLAMAALLLLPLAANADEFWTFFPSISTLPAVDVGSPDTDVLFTSTPGGKTITLHAYEDGTNLTGGQLTGRNSGFDEFGAGVHAIGAAITTDSASYEVNGNEAIKVVFPDLKTIPGAASEHLFFNSLEGGDVAAIWKDAPFVAANLIGTQAETAIEPHDFNIPASAFGHDIYVTADPNTPGSTILLYGASVDTVSGCTLTFGYWKTHSIYGPAAHPDPTWNKLPDGPNTQFFFSNQTYLEVLQTNPRGGNAYYILAHQYIAALLNQLSGASSTPAVDTALAWSFIFFSTYKPSSTLPTGVRNQAISYADLLDQYNEGTIGPGPCPED